MCDEPEIHLSHIYMWTQPGNLLAGASGQSELFWSIVFFSCVRECHLCYKLNISPLFRIFQEKSSYYETWHINLSPYPPKRLMIHQKECLIMALKLVWGLPVIIIPFPKFWQCLQISQNLANPTTLNRIPSDCQMCLRTSQEWIQRKRPFLDLLFISAIEERLQRSDAIENLGNGKKQPRCQVSALFGTSEFLGFFFSFQSHSWFKSDKAGCIML